MRGMQSGPVSNHTPASAGAVVVAVVVVVVVVVAAGMRRPRPVIVASVLASMRMDGEPGIVDRRPLERRQIHGVFLSGVSSVSSISSSDSQTEHLSVCEMAPACF